MTRIIIWRYSTMLADPSFRLMYDNEGSNQLLNTYEYATAHLNGIGIQYTFAHIIVQTSKYGKAEMCQAQLL